MTVGSTIISAFRDRVWRRSKHSVAEHFGDCKVHCMSLTDLSCRPTPYRNTFVSSRSEENILEPKSDRRNSWKRRSLFPPVESTSNSLSQSYSARSRPQSCLIDYTSASINVLGEKQFLPVIMDCETGHMDMSTDSLSSLIRVDSIQEKSREIMRRRHRFVKKRQRDSQVLSDEEQDDVMKRSSTESSSEIMSSVTCNRRSVHFDEVQIETVDKKKSDLKPSVSTISIVRNNSVQLKSWQIRRHRRALFNKQKRTIRLLTEDLKYEERLIN
ncbi:hypothetical protein FSP39_000849 [Pinctada imbricata]|uniref:Uncharacterized protein n=1 Tax=Pinctada imbricata TaxID=66713 RepID=A0AA89C616_PINIB|nr:hypothetical protein FSP39_000849 [Pinctada imbricata]